MDKSEYLNNIQLFLEDFFNKGCIKEDNDDIVFEMKRTDTRTIDGITTNIFEVDYGRNGYPFSVRSETKNIPFGIKDKIVHNYKIIFYEMPSGNVFMVAFRVAHYSCKSAVLNSMCSFLRNSNVIPCADPIPIPESLLDLGTSENIVAIECDYIEKVTPNDLSKAPTISKGSKKISSLSIDVQKPSLKEKFMSFLSKTIDCFKQTSREAICSKIKTSATIDGCEPDPESLRIVVLIGGKKRTIRLSDAESMLFFYDVTERIQSDEQGYACVESVEQVSRDYVKEIDKLWTFSK